MKVTCTYTHTSSCRCTSLYSVLAYPFPRRRRLFDRGGHSDVEVGGMHGEGGGTDGQVGERDGGTITVTNSRQQAAFPCGVSG